MALGNALALILDTSANGSHLQAILAAATNVKRQDQCRSSSNSSTVARPPITTAIDVWPRDRDRGQTCDHRHEAKGPNENPISQIRSGYSMFVTTSSPARVMSETCKSPSSVSARKWTDAVGEGIHAAAHMERIDFVLVIAIHHRRAARAQSCATKTRCPDRPSGRPRQFRKSAKLDMWSVHLRTSRASGVGHVHDRVRKPSVTSRKNVRPVWPVRSPRRTAVVS